MADVYCEGQFPDGCGQKVADRPIRLDLLLVQILRHLVKSYPEPVQTSALRVEMPGPAYSVVSKLKYFNLAHQPKGRGSWAATQLGLWFVKGWQTIVPKVWVYNDEVVRRQGDPVGIEEIDTYEEVSHESVAAESVPHDFGETTP